MKLDTEKYHRSREVSVWRILLILIAVNAVLGVFVLAFPSGERWLGDDLRLQFVSSYDLFTKKEKKVVDLDSVLGDISFTDTISSGKDSIIHADSSIKISDLEKRIQYPQGSKALANFFEALYALENGSNELYRILHYGDSQLEGDRISDYLRNKLQLRFGGSGPGIILPIDISRSRVSIRQGESRDWKKYAIYSKKRNPQGAYGLGGSSYVYSGSVPVKVGVDTTVSIVYDSMISLAKVLQIQSKDTTVNGTVDSTIYTWVPYDSTQFHYDSIFKDRYEYQATESSWLRFACATKSYPNVRFFEKVELMFAANDTCRLQISIDGMVSSKKLYPKKGLQKITLHKGVVKHEVRLKFSGASPVVFGVLLDGDKGIAVDNFPMRGSSGTGYGLIKRSLYAQQLTGTGTKLIIMQYGINVVPNPTKNYGFYERMFLKELQIIKAAAPDIEILVIGPSDMSRKVAGEYVSYPNITKIRDAMRNAAFQSDCAFWDLYSAMGGENSMVSWVQNTPSLASKDFTHFNARGAKYVGEMLHDALISEYLNWKSLKAKKQS